MKANSAFIEALDVLSFRGNRLFGDPGSWGEAIVPPPPSVAAGALRSQLLARERVDLADFAGGRVQHPAVGSRERPGSLTLAAFHLARHRADGAVEPLFPLPADVQISGERQSMRVLTMRPQRIGSIIGSAALPCWPALAQGTERGKPVGGLWLTGDGLHAWLRGEPIDGQRHVVPSTSLWRTEARVGVGLDATLRRAEDRKLFSLQALTFMPGVGFAVQVAGAEPKEGLLRFGGDGRGARLVPCEIRWPEPDWEAIAAAKRARLLLTSPGIFERGWLPTGAGEPSPAEGAPFELDGVRGRIVCAAVPRAQFVSGWDLARWQPKTGQRAAPAGSVYWIEELEATPEALRKLVARGLWTAQQYDSDPRRAEGFNRFTFAAY
jgi:CRISPR-associated protein Cmr3